MKKKLLLAIALTAVASCAAAFGVGCSKPNSADNAPKHNYGEWVIDREASCTRIGQKYHVCQDEDCNSLEWEAIPMLPHDYKIVESITASEHTLKCSGCEDTKTEVHVFNEETNICAVCGYEDGKLYELKCTLNADNNSYTVLGFDFVLDNVTEITIPATYNGLAVTVIGKQAFKGCTNLKSVTISDGVTTIDDYAFSGCNNLAEIDIPNSIKSIGNYSLNNYNDKFSTTYILHIHFNGSQALWNNIEKGISWCYNPIVIVCYEVLSELGITLNFKRDGTFEVAKVDATVTNLIIPSKHNEISITSIGSSAFSGCTSLTSVTIPDSVTSIGWGAFYGCNGLESVTIPDSVTSIGERAFEDCSGLTSITIPDSVTYIGGYVFRNCISLTSITIPDGVWSIESGVFSGCSGLTSVTIGDGVTHIGNAFENCISLTSIIIPDSVTSLGLGAFAYCSGLTSITVDENNQNYKSINNCILTKDGKTLVLGCKNSIIPNSVTSIGESAFLGCSGLTSITIPDSVTSIDRYAFSGCSGLESVTIPDSVTSISWGAFAYCSGLTSITVDENNQNYKSINNCILTKDGKTLVLGCKNSIIPNSVTSIGEGAFLGCSGLTSITIPDSVTSIDRYTFLGCSGLESVTIPDSVTSISWGAFYDCQELTSVYYKGSTEDWSNLAVDSNNSALADATRYYYSESEPTDNGNYWHYDTDGITPVIWTKEN